MRRPFEGFLSVLAIGDPQIKLARGGGRSSLSNRSHRSSRVLALVKIKAERPIVERQVLFKRSENLLRQPQVEAVVLHGNVVERNTDFSLRQLNQLALTNNCLPDGLGGFQAATIVGESDINLHKVGRIIIGNTRRRTRLLGNSVPVGFLGSCGSIVEFEGLGVRS